jgi:hypothetical protein
VSDEIVQGEGYAVGNIDRMGDAYGFRKIRRELGVTAFGVNASTVRRIKNVGDDDAVYVIVGGKDGYVGRDGRAPEGETSRFGPSGPPGA